MIGPEPQRGQRQTERGAHLAAGGGGERVRAGQVAFGEAGSNAVAERGQQAGAHGQQGHAWRRGTGHGAEPRLADHQQRHTDEPDREAQHARAARAVMEPQPGHQRPGQRYRGVEDRGETGRDVRHRERKQHKRDAGIEQTDEQDRFRAFPEIGPNAFDEEHRQEEQGGQRDAHPGGGECAQLGDAQAHEQERGAPQGGQQQKFGDQGRRHGVVQSGSDVPPSSRSSAALRSSPPA